ncbi:17S U2 SnRNP complex component HTATSF1-like isoform X2 [Panulirus ornatus]|uniref:17S U2 SnRNP complex component HTATSF1-like isoform X2 n=1 Tax=Panulirus ornatus TaxID=150431 RepID=UPI003A83F3C0
MIGTVEMMADPVNTNFSNNQVEADTQSEGDMGVPEKNKQSDFCDVSENTQKIDPSDSKPVEVQKTGTKPELVSMQVDEHPTEADSSLITDGENEKNEKNCAKGGTQPDFDSNQNYEYIRGQYYYTDNISGQRYLYDADAGEWVVTSRNNGEDKNEQQVTTDSEGRTYYYAENMYLCRDPHGNVFFLNENNEWKPWTEKDASIPQSGGEKNSKWYFYEGDSVFYRDNTSNTVYKLHKEKNEWEIFEGKLKKSRPHIDDVEEFDTDEDEDSEESNSGLVPPGANSDPNISYDGVTYTKLDPSDSMMYEWDANRRAWFPKVDEDFMATYQLSYGFNPDGTKNENPLKFDDEEEEEEAARRAKEEEEKKKKKVKETKKKPSWFEMDEAQNTKVYVSNLPDSLTENEFLELMQKCGLILRDVSTNKPKIKMYRDEEGNFKGDALCTYIKKESVNLALQILDEYQVGNKKIRVEQAKFELKGAYNPKLKPRKRQKKEVEKLQKRQEKLFDWRPEPLRGQRLKHENTVVIRNVFDPKEFITAMEKILVHKDAMRNQCSNFGRIKKLDLYDLHPEGIVQVRFEEVEAADMCVATLNRRLYNGRTLQVSTWDGKEKFRIEETEAERQERLKKWSKFLEDEKDAKQ